MAFATKDNLHVGDTLYAVFGPNWSGNIGISEVLVTKVNGTSFYYTLVGRSSTYGYRASMSKGYERDMGGVPTHLYRTKEEADRVFNNHARRKELRESLAYKVRSASLSDLEKINAILGGDSDDD